MSQEMRTNLLSDAMTESKPESAVFVYQAREKKRRFPRSCWVLSG
jgi:hypothetical protein